VLKSTLLNRRIAAGRVPRVSPDFLGWLGNTDLTLLANSVICDLLGLLPYLPGGLIKSQAEECGVPQAVFGRPFYESDLRDQLRLRPVHLAHLIRRDTCAPSPDISVRKIGKWAILNLQRFQLAEKLATNVRNEARAHLSGEA
jgi:hypothetical protein